MSTATATRADLPAILTLEESFTEARWSEQAWAEEPASDRGHVLAERDAAGAVLGAATFSSVADVAFNACTTALATDCVSDPDSGAAVSLIAYFGGRPTTLRTRSSASGKLLSPVRWTSVEKGVMSVLYVRPGDSMR